MTIITSSTSASQAYMMVYEQFYIFNFQISTFSLRLPDHIIDKSHQVYNNPNIDQINVHDPKQLHHSVQ